MNAAPPRQADAAPGIVAMPAYALRYLDDPSPIILLWWSRSVLKTTAVARRVVTERLSGRVARDAIYTTVNEANGEEFLRAVKRDLELAGQVSEVLWGTETIDGLDVRVGYVEFPAVRGGGANTRPRAKYISSSATAFRGLRGDIIIDEVGFVTDLDSILTAAAGCASIGATLTMMTSGITEGSVADALVEMGVRRRDGAPRPGDMPVSLHTVTIDQAIGDGVVEYLRRVTGMRLTRDEWRAHCRMFYRTEQQWLEETGCVKRRRTESMYLPPALTERLRRDNDGGVATGRNGLLAAVARAAAALGPTELFAGYDVARRGHLSVVWVWGRCGPLLRTLGVLRMRDVPYRDQHDAVRALMDADFARDGDSPLRVRRLAVDATGLGGQLAEDLERAFRARAEPVTMTASVKDDLMSRLRKHVEGETITLPGGAAGEEIVADFASIRAEVTAAGNVRYVAEETDLGHADHAWAAALGLHAAERPTGGGYFVEVEGGADY